jgi:hypothetical protein
MSKQIGGDLPTVDHYIHNDTVNGGAGVSLKPCL